MEVRQLSRAASSAPEVLRQLTSPAAHPGTVPQADTLGRAAVTRHLTGLPGSGGFGGGTPVERVVGEVPDVPVGPASGLDHPDECGSTRLVDHAEVVKGEHHE